jgi:hypothetical protein
MNILNILNFEKIAANLPFTSVNCFVESNFGLRLPFTWRSWLLKTVMVVMAIMVAYIAHGVPIYGSRHKWRLPFTSVNCFVESNFGGPEDRK